MPSFVKVVSDVEYTAPAAAAAVTATSRTAAPAAIAPPPPPIAANDGDGGGGAEKKKKDDDDDDSTRRRREPRLRRLRQRTRDAGPDAENGDVNDDDIDASSSANEEDEKKEETTEISGAKEEVVEEDEQQQQQPQPSVVVLLAADDDHGTGKKTTTTTTTSTTTTAVGDPPPSSSSAEGKKGGTTDVAAIVAEEGKDAAAGDAVAIVVAVDFSRGASEADENKEDGEENTKEDCRAREGKEDDEAKGDGSAAAAATDAKSGRDEEVEVVELDDDSDEDLDDLPLDVLRERIKGPGDDEAEREKDKAKDAPADLPVAEAPAPAAAAPSAQNAATEDNGGGGAEPSVEAAVVHDPKLAMLSRAEEDAAETAEKSKPPATFDADVVHDPNLARGAPAKDANQRAGEGAEEGAPKKLGTIVHELGAAPSASSMSSSGNDGSRTTTVAPTVHAPETPAVATSAAEGTTGRTDVPILPAKSAARNAARVATAEGTAEKSPADVNGGRRSSTRIQEANETRERERMLREANEERERTLAEERARLREANEERERSLAEERVRSRARNGEQNASGAVGGHQSQQSQQPTIRSDGASVLPERHTKDLIQKMKEIAEWLAEAERKKSGAQMFYWHILGANDMQAIARRVPTTPAELSACGLSDATVRLYGRSIVSGVSEFIRSRRLQRYVQQKYAGSGDAAVVRREVGTKKRKGDGGMVLPQGYTEDLKRKLKEYVKVWAAESQMQGIAISGNDILNRATIASIARSVPTSVEDLSDCDVSFQTLKVFGERIVSGILQFVRSLQLEQFLIDKVDGDSAPVPATATASATAAVRARTVQTAGQTEPRPSRVPVQQAGRHKVSTTRPNADGRGAGHRLQPNPRVTTRGQSQNDEVTSQPQVCDRERWSEYRINAASSVDDLEAIRRRLLTLVDRVDVRVNDMRLVEALNQMGDGGVAAENLEALTTQDLMARLSREVEKSTAETEDRDSGVNKKSTSNEGKDANGKHDASEVSADAIMADRDNKRPRLSTTCPLCFEKIEPQCTTTGTCEICDESNLCNQCLVSCTLCRRSTCADCLMGCDSCGSGYHCSDCMEGGGGKCFTCRTKKKTVSSVNERSKKLRQLRTANPTTSQRANTSVGYSQFSYPQAVSQRLIPNRQNPGFPPYQTGFAPLQQRLHSYPQNHQVPPSSLQTLTHNVTNSTQPTSSQYSYPRPQKTGVNPVRLNAQGPPTTYSIHRFIMSQRGTLGISIMQSDNQKCLISVVTPKSLAHDYGVKVNDEILPPCATGRNPPSTYKLFLSAANDHRPLMFEVKRRFPGPEADASTIMALKSLHRFVITEPGSLGMSLGKKMDGITFVTNVASKSLAELHGIRDNDIICKPGTNGIEKADIQGFFADAIRGARPLIIEVLRDVPAPTGEGTIHMWQQTCNAQQNAFKFSFPPPTLAVCNNVGGKEAPANLTNKRVAEKRAMKKSAPIILLDDDSAEE